MSEVGEGAGEQSAPWHDKQLLDRLYSQELMSDVEIADELGCSHATISVWRSKHGIPTRSPSEATSLSGHGRTTYAKLSDRDWLREQYVKKQRSDPDIADELDCSVGAVGTARRNHNIPTRDRSVAVSIGKAPDGVYEKVSDRDWLHEQYVELEKSDYTIAAELGTNHETVRTMRLRQGIESLSTPEANSVARLSANTRKLLSDDDWLREQYVRMCRTDGEIADELGCGRSTIRRRRRLHAIESHESPLFLWESSGGRSLRRYLLNNLSYLSWASEIAPRVRERDSHQCQIPSCNYEPSNGDKALDVHHIVPLLDAGCNADELLVSLCQTCHHRTELYTHQNVLEKVPGRSFIEVAREFAEEMGVEL